MHMRTMPVVPSVRIATGFLAVPCDALNWEASAGDRALPHEGGLPFQAAVRLRSDAGADDRLRSQSSHAADEDNVRPFLENIQGSLLA